MQKVAILAIALLGFAAVARASPTNGACTLDLTVGPHDKFNRTCSSCQWACLTNDHCNGITFEGVKTAKTELALQADCGDGYFSTRSAGLCVLYDSNSQFIAGIFDTQEQSCAECAQQCNTDSRCTSFAHNGVAYAKGDSCSGGVAPIVIPPSPSVPVVIPPSPVPVIPSPELPPPSPELPPPSPAVRPDKVGIVVRPGICNYDIIKYDVEVLSRQIILDSDECCTLCAETEGCNVASFCFDSEDNAGCGADGSIPRYTCELGKAVLGADGFPVTALDKTDPNAKGWVTVTVTPANVPLLFAESG